MQQALKELFYSWGVPRAIRVDNGRPFGDPQRTSILELPLWLIALGVEVIWNRPRSPRDNAKVERMQATTARWVEVHKCPTTQQLQRRLDQAAQIHTQTYRVKRLGKRSREQVYADLWTNRRVYQPKDVKTGRVLHYLSTVLFVRKVNGHGIFHFYGQSVYVGRSYNYQTVMLLLNPKQKHFDIFNRHNELIAYLRADNFTKNHICNLSVCNTRYVKCQNLLSQKSSKT